MLFYSSTFVGWFYWRFSILHIYSKKEVLQSLVSWSHGKEKSKNFILWNNEKKEHNKLLL